MQALWPNLQDGIYQSRQRTKRQRSDRGDGDERQRDQGYGPCTRRRKEYRHVHAKKKFNEIVEVNPYVGYHYLAVEIRQLIDPSIKTEADEQWSFVQNKKNQRWLWYAIDSATGQILSFVFGRRTDAVCKKLISSLKAFNISKYFTDDWASYAKYIPADKHVIGKRGTQKIENKNLLLRTRIKRLARKTICFSKNEKMHDGVIGLFINRYCFQSN
jgi:insertion element IS1 protein InsB